MTEQEAMKRYTVGLNGTAFNGMFECDEGTWMKFEDVEQPLKNEARRIQLINKIEDSLEHGTYNDAYKFQAEVKLRTLRNCEGEL